MEREGRQLLSLAFQEERSVVEAVDEIATREGLSRASVLRKLIRLGMERYTRRERIVDAIEEGVA